MDELLTPPQVKAILLVAISTGVLSFSGHARTEMAADKMTEVDVVNVLRGGAVQEGEFEGGSFRYRVMTSKFVVVVAIETTEHAIVVTAWRIKRR